MSVYYHTYGSVASHTRVHQKAVHDCAKIIKDAVGMVFLKDVHIWVYDPQTMTTVEVHAMKSEVNKLEHGTTTEKDIRNGIFCGGVCGATTFMAYLPDNYNVAHIQESAVHETTHIFQIHYQAQAYNNGQGDDDEHWRCKGPRWFTEGSATILGDLLLRSYPQLFQAPNPDQTNHGRKLSESCIGFKIVSKARDLRLDDGSQMSDSNGQRLHDDLRDGHSAYYSIIYEGGVCACTFYLDTVLGSHSLRNRSKKCIVTLLTIIKDTQTRDDWEVAFIAAGKNKWSNMKEFYTDFEKTNRPNYEYRSALDTHMQRYPRKVKQHNNEQDFEIPHIPEIHVTPNTPSGPVPPPNSKKQRWVNYLVDKFQFMQFLLPMSDVAAVLCLVAIVFGLVAIVLGVLWFVRNVRKNRSNSDAQVVHLNTLLPPRVVLSSPQ